MSLHINAKDGAISERVLLPGDPLRAKFLAENYLENPVCYNEVRGMYGFTGLYKGERISVQATGMGIPSISIYINELISSYKVKKLIRIGSCGSAQESVKVRDIVVAQATSTNSSLNQARFQGASFAPIADFKLLETFSLAAQKGNIPIHVGNILTSDEFYNDDPDSWKLWSRFGVLAVEMESAALYTLAAKFNVSALAVFTVSDSMVTGETTTAKEREKTFTQMMDIALATLIS